METTISKYQKQANDFLQRTGATISVQFKESGHHFADDKEVRDIYTVTIARGKRSYTFDFGQSLAESGFYYTKGKQRVDLDRKLLGSKNLVTYIKSKDWSFLNNGKSDVIHYPKAPSNYSILAGLTKYDPGTLEQFCDEFGYDTDSKKAEEVYEGVQEEYLNLCSLFNDEEMEELTEIS